MIPFLGGNSRPPLPTGGGAFFVKQDCASARIPRSRHYPSNGFRTMIVSSRSGLVDTSVIGASTNSSIRRTYFTTCAAPTILAWPIRRSGAICDPRTRRHCPAYDNFGAQGASVSRGAAIRATRGVVAARSPSRAALPHSPAEPWQDQEMIAQGGDPGPFFTVTLTVF